MKRGPPSPYRVEFAEQAKKMAMCGATDVDMARIFGVSFGQFQAWLDRYPELAGAVAMGREGADADVVEALYKRAIGYRHPEVQLFVDRGTRENPSFEVVEHVTMKQYPPDTAAIEFWLTNRLKDKWKKSQTVENTGPDGAPLLPPLIQFNFVDSSS